MTEVVLDASVIIKWWRTEGEDGVEEARALRASFEAGELTVVAPPLLYIEVVNAFGRRWAWPEEDLVELADALVTTGFVIVQPNHRSVARWTARGLTAYDAAYVAVAESHGIGLVTADDRILDRVPTIARALGA